MANILTNVPSLTIVNFQQSNFITEGNFPDDIATKVKEAAMMLFGLCYLKLHKETVPPLLIDRLLKNPFKPEMVEIANELLNQFKETYQNQEIEIKQQIEAKVETSIESQKSWWDTMSSVAQFVVSAVRPIVQQVEQQKIESKITIMTEDMIRSLTDESFMDKLYELPGYQKLLDKFPDIKLWSLKQTGENAKRIEEALQTLTLTEMEEFSQANQKEIMDKIQKKLKYSKTTQRSTTNLPIEEDLDKFLIQESVIKGMTTYQQENDSFQSGSFQHNGMSHDLSMHATAYLFKEKSEDQDILEAGLDLVLWGNRLEGRKKLEVCIKNLNQAYSLQTIFDQVYCEKLESQASSLQLQEMQSKTQTLLTNRTLHALYLASQYMPFVDKTLRQTFEEAIKPNEKELKLMKDVKLIKP